MSGNSVATWKTVSTLEWRKKQKAPAEPKGFGAILGEAADVVVDKRTAAGSLAPAYNSRLSEIQIQYEAYIHQQLVKPEESKIRRGLQRLISLGKSKSGKGVRILRPGGATSRKVRFNEDPHSSKAPAAQQQLGAAGTAEAGVAVKGSSIVKKAVAAPGALKSGLRFAEPPSAETAPSSAAAGVKPASTQVAHAGVSQASNAAADAAPASTAAAGGSSAASGAHQPPGQQSDNAAATTQPSRPSVAVQMQQPSSSSGVSFSGGTGASAQPSSYASRGNSGEGSSAPAMMALYLQQQLAQQPPQTPSFAASSVSGNWTGSSSGNWEACSRTELADKQLQRLRTTMAPPAAPAAVAAAAAAELDASLGYRPLAIPEETFERWSSVAGGGSGGVGSSRQARMSLDMAPVAAGPAAAASTGAAAAGARFSASRSSNTGTAPATQPEAGQTASAQLGRRSSREVNVTLQLASSSSSPDLAATAAAAAGGPNSSRSSGEATNSKQRRTSDYLSTLSSIEASLHPTRRSTGHAGSPVGNVPASAAIVGGRSSPSQPSSSPRSRHSSSSITASPHMPATSGSAVPGSASKASRSSSLPDVQELLQQPQQRSPSPFKSGASAGSAGSGGPTAAGAASGVSGRNSRPSSTLRRSRMSQDSTDSPSWPRSASPSGSGGRGASSSSPGTSSSGSGMLHSHHQQQQQQRSCSSAASAGMTRKSSSSLLHLPVISKPAANQKSSAASAAAKR